MPPSATAGLGLAAGELYLARGALALFATNMVTIALAASAVLLAVGIRVLQREHRWVRHIVAFLVLGLVGLVFFLLGREPPGTAIELPAIVEDRVRAGELAPGERLLGMTARNTETGIDVTVELGCTEPPPAATITARAASLRDYVDWLVEEDVERLELHYSLRAVDTSR